NVPLTDGQFKTALPSGDYHISVQGISGRVYVKELASGSVDLFAAPLHVAASDDPVSVTMTLAVSDGVRVRGHVTTGESKPISGTLFLTGAVTRSSVEAAAGADGAFEIPKLMPGAYMARIGLTADVASPPTLVVIPAGDVEDLRVTVPAPRQISGDVVVQG